jgi:hypothetical protein
MAVLSPESGQPEAQAGSCSAVPLMSWPSARKVFAPDGEAGAEAGVEAGAETGGDAGAEATALGDPAEVTEVADGGALAADELADELQAVTSNAAPANAAAAVSCLPLRAFVVNIDFPAPQSVIAAQRAR